MSRAIPLEKLISTHYGRILRAAGLLSGCDWDADDLTQETFVRAAEAWHRFRRQFGRIRLAVRFL